jgi:hypothetical protein
MTAAPSSSSFTETMQMPELFDTEIAFYNDRGSKGLTSRWIGSIGSGD